VLYVIISFRCLLMGVHLAPATASRQASGKGPPPAMPVMVQSRMGPKARSFFIAFFTFSAELEDDIPVALRLRRYDLLRTRERAVAKVPVHLEGTT
jgi:hypothetical protein